MDFMNWYYNYKIVTYTGKDLAPLLSLEMKYFIQKLLNNTK
jgi:hypothetical protein